MKFVILKKTSAIQLGLVCEVLTNESKFDTVEYGKLSLERPKWIYLTINFINNNLN